MIRNAKWFATAEQVVFEKLKDWFNPSCIRMNIWGEGVVEFENLIIFSNANGCSPKSQGNYLFHMFVGTLKNKFTYFLSSYCRNTCQIILPSYLHVINNYILYMSSNLMQDLALFRNVPSNK
jgi:hypothetical protein